MIFVLILCIALSGFLGAFVVYGPLDAYLPQNETAQEIIFIFVSGAIYFLIINIGQLAITLVESVCWRLKKKRERKRKQALTEKRRRTVELKSGAE